MTKICQFFRRKFLNGETVSAGLSEKRSNVGSWSAQPWFVVRDQTRNRIPEPAQHFFTLGERMKEMVQPHECGCYDYKFLVSKAGNIKDHAHLTLRFKKCGTFSHIVKYVPPKSER